MRMTQMMSQYHGEQVHGANFRAHAYTDLAGSSLMLPRAHVIQLLLYGVQERRTELAVA